VRLQKGHGRRAVVGEIKDVRCKHPESIIKARRPVGEPVPLICVVEYVTLTAIHRPCVSRWAMCCWQVVMARVLNIQTVAAITQRAPDHWTAHSAFQIFIFP
jgi:hypothetical protein